MAEIPTAADIADTLVEMLAGAAGGDPEDWRKAIGKITQLPAIVDIHSNWRVTPAGTAAQKRAIAKAVDLVREANPYIVG